MFSIKTALVLTAAMAMVGASPALKVPRREDDNCQNYLGDCFGNDCNGVFSVPSDTIGTCTTGTFNGCPCEKCGSGSGYTGACDANGCSGNQGLCTAGQYQGCPCN